MTPEQITEHCMEYADANTAPIHGRGSLLWWEHFDFSLTNYTLRCSPRRQAVRNLAREAIAREAEQAQAAAIKRQQEEGV